jgi:hypothetical protein
VKFFNLDSGIHTPRAIDTSSVFARFLDDQMQNVFHSTTYTQRFKDVT